MSACVDDLVMDFFLPNLFFGETPKETSYVLDGGKVWAVDSSDLMGVLCVTDPFSFGEGPNDSKYFFNR